MSLQARTLLLHIMLLLFLGCGITACSGPAVRSTEEVAIVPAKTVDLNDSARVKTLLKSQYHEWKSVRHRLGGLSKKGIDCSGLVYLTYLSRLGIRVPRSTEMQSTVGVAIKQHQLRAGDLVFFKTGLKQRHVGIYMGKRQFLHASSSQGVSVASLDNTYWAKSYWKARRVNI